MVASTDDNMGSDTSSDLFEMESFSTQTTLYPTYKRRDSLDDAQIFGARRLAVGNRRIVDEEPPATPSVAGTECYAPSEVSVDWNVTMAHGFDRAACPTYRCRRRRREEGGFHRRRVAGQEEGDGGVGKRKGGGGGLLMMSCRQGKAVSVGPQLVRFMSARAEGGAVAVAVAVGGRPPRGSKTATTAAMGGDHAGRTLVII
ncbi:Protein PHYTOCHROME KINASE SUBSTRATE 1 [Striga hermonthica]|uniref:Protein PHYTOCHROME KINASE SUBSTRATE 1 n=1 Tax=Striga hermonthica TaxID=68872 RepID=A0A9N7NNZ3_STRHE|nr:Protein PHYTOCHROME KINASE SUBSTRATE 1 [Striga hermonthica]